MLSVADAIRAILAESDILDADSAHLYEKNGKNGDIRLSVRDILEGAPAQPYEEDEKNEEIGVSPLSPFFSYPREESRHLDQPEDAAAVVVCFSCWGSDFWQGSGAVVCRRCHPPAPRAERPATTSTRTNGVRGGAR